MSAESPGPDATGVPTCYRHPDREAHIRCQRCERVICPDCMRPAAVGFQCPECVALGRKETRSGRTAYGGRPSLDESRTSLVLIAVNVAVWIAVLATGGAAGRLFALLALSPTGVCRQGSGYYPGADETACGLIGGSATWSPGVVEGAVWQLLTSMFTHVEVLHIGFNMLALWILGPQLEGLLGRVRFLVVYLGAGLAGSTLVYWLADEQSATMGASGSVFGILGALLVVVLKRGGDPRGILLWLGINVAITFLWAGISWQGHIGGLLGGAALAAVLVLAPRGRRQVQIQWLGVAAVGAVLLLALLGRTLVLL